MQKKKEGSVAQLVEATDLKSVQCGFDPRQIHQGENMEEKHVWEILVPTIDKDNIPFTIKFHKEWDKYVRNLTGGLTVCPQTKGQWTNESGDLFIEKMIPVKIVTTRERMEWVVTFTKDYYNQEAILAYRISSEFILLEEE